MASPSWWTKETLAVVTGGNKGIGLEIVRQFAKKGLSVVLTARNEERGLSAKEKLKSEGLDVQFHKLDVTCQDSVSKFADWIKKQNKGIDILVNNAAVIGTDFNYENVMHLLNTNYYGVKTTSSTLLKLMKPTEAGNRIVNVSSSLGQLERLNMSSYKEQLTDIVKLSEETIDSFVKNYLSAVKEGKEELSRWPKGIIGAYTVSKIAVNAYTRLLARDLRKQEEKIYVNCVHPGYVKTDMNNHKGILSTEDGADTVVWLSLLPLQDPFPSGDFFYQRTKFLF